MAAIPIYIIGTITMKSPKGGEVSGSGIEQCVISGLASIEGVGVGGGPIIPPTQPPGGEKPPGIWGGGNVPMPTPPIANVPGLPPTTDPPGRPPEPIQPPVDWKPIWAGPEHGWVVVGVPTGDHPAPAT